MMLNKKSQTLKKYINGIKVSIYKKLKNRCDWLMAIQVKSSGFFMGGGIMGGGIMGGVLWERKPREPARMPEMLFVS